MSARPILIDKEHGVPVKFKGKSREVLTRMIEQGWTGRMSTRGHAIMKHPLGETTSIGANLSLANRSSQNSAAAMKRVEKRLAGIRTAEERALQKIATEEKEMATEQVREPERHMVDMRPWKAHMGSSKLKIKGGGYAGIVSESQTVVERVWNDGTIDFGCSQCAYVASTPRSVSAHYARQSKLGKHPKAEVGVDKSADPTYTSRITKSRRPLKVVAEPAAVSAPFKGQNVGGSVPVKTTPAEPAGPAQVAATEPPTVANTLMIIDQIRALLDNGENARLRTEVEGLRERLGAANARANKLEDDLRAFKDLVAGL